MRPIADAARRRVVEAAGRGATVPGIDLNSLQDIPVLAMQAEGTVEQQLFGVGDDGDASPATEFLMGTRVRTV